MMLRKHLSLISKMWLIAKKLKVLCRLTDNRYTKGYFAARPNDSLLILLMYILFDMR